MLAGGLVTNTNQSASFVRNPARDAVIDLDAVYSNPGGTCFLPLGFHLGFTAQHPEQQRDITTSFASLAMNQEYLGQSTRKYNGHASAPLVPSMQAAYAMEKWTVSASFAIGGGGGMCQFKEGIGSIESTLSLVPMKVASEKGLPIGNYLYKMNAEMEGRQFYYCAQVGAAYKVNEHIGIFAGLRGIYGFASYEGSVRNIQFTAADATATAPYTQAVIAGVNAQVGDIEMTTDQNCLSWLPVLGIDYRINEHWNLAAKYEFRAKMDLKNKSDMNDMARSLSALDKFNDQKNKRVRDDIPGTFTTGIEYSPIQQVRLSAGFHLYADQDTKKFNNEQDLIDGNTIEFLVGAEWDITDLLTISCGWQNTIYDLSDAYMQDMSFNLSSQMMALGVRLNLTEKMNLDLGFMHNFYKDRTVVNNNFMGTGLQKTDKYKRTNDVLAIGINYNF